jgi:hypothetical protein
MVVLEEALHMTIVSKARILEIADIKAVASTFILESAKAHKGLYVTRIL